MSETDNKPTDGAPVETPVEKTTPENQPTPKEDNNPNPPAEKKTVAEIMDNNTPKNKDTVGLDKFLEIKKENKELRQSLKDLETKINEGATKAELSSDIEDIANEFPEVDPKFLSMLGKVVENRASKIAEERLRPIAEKDKLEKQDSQFTKHLNSVLEEMPEYKGVVNPKVIKRLALDPDNADKTFPELIEETYGNAISGRRTIESTVPGGGKEPQPLDVNRAIKDPAYFQEIMNDPKLKAEYNKQMLERGI